MFLHRHFLFTVTLKNEFYSCKPILSVIRVPCNKAGKNEADLIWKGWNVEKLQLTWQKKFKGSKKHRWFCVRGSSIMRMEILCQNVHSCQCDSSANSMKTHWSGFLNGWQKFQIRMWIEISVSYSHSLHTECAVKWYPLNLLSAYALCWMSEQTTQSYLNFHMVMQ